MSIYDIGKIGRRGAYINDDGTMLHETWIHMQSACMAHIHEGCTAFGNNIYIGKARRLHESCILFPSVLTPTGRASYNGGGNLRHESHIVFGQRPDHALGKAADIHHRLRVRQISRFKPHTRIFRT